MRITLLASMLSILPLLLFGQDWNTFSLAAARGDRRVYPKRAAGVSVGEVALRDLLLTAPHETAVAAERSPTLLAVPLPDGTTADFRIVAYDIAADSDRFPGIRTWYGINPDVAGQTVFVDWTARGFHASVSGGGRPAVFVDPLFRGDRTRYQVYHRQELPAGKAPFGCSTAAAVALDGGSASAGQIGDCALRQYTLAVSATPDYSNYHGAASATDAHLVHSAVVTTVNRVNQIYTRDLSLRLQLAAGNEALYFYGPADNPFSGNDVGTLLNENTAVTDERLGKGTYSLGHVFSQGANDGIARIFSACSDFSPGAGVTRLVTPEGDVFDVDYVAHEIGHQLGANHTQNNNCNYSSTSGMEPGSGSTVMSYAGICPPNVQSNTDGYFHGRNMEEIASYLEVGDDEDCATVLDTSLTSPVLTGDPAFFVPSGTPLRLRASAQGDGSLLHNWEQFDAEQGPMPPDGMSDRGPLFRSFTPTTDTFRYAPTLHSVIAAFNPVWEEIPRAGRTVNFRMTTRNTNAAYGCAAGLDVAVNVADNSPPFRVTDPATANKWSEGQIAQVGWDVAGTDAPPYRSPAVDVLLTVDNGRSFHLLATDVPNNGFTEVSVPTGTTDNARLLVRSSDNIFYNVSPRAFEIVSAGGPAAIDLVGLSPLNTASCFTLTDAVTYDLMAEGSGGATEYIHLSVDGLPEEVDAAFSRDSIRPGGAFRLTVSGIRDLPQGNYSGFLSADSPEADDAVRIGFTKLADEPTPGPLPVGPTATIADTRPTLTARPNGMEEYEFQVATTPDFDDLLYATTQPDTAFSLPDYLAPLTRYYWRVRSRQFSESCAISRWSAADFTTGPCYRFVSDAGAQVIGTGGPPQTAGLRLNVPIDGDITDLDVNGLDIDHTFTGDLVVELVSPAGTEIELVRRECGSQNDLRLNLDDEGENADRPCPLVAPARYFRPLDALAAFDGESFGGNWTVHATDMANQDGGSLRGFGLVACLENLTLPVTFEFFAAIGRKDDILLTWTTTREENNRGFYVERTTNTAGQWAELGFVAAGADYTFTDRTAQRNTDYFYRLRQTDLDGRIGYGPLRSARIDGTAGSLLIFPNPTDGRLTFHRTGSEPLTYRLTDVSGRALHTGSLRGEWGTLDLGHLPTGIYLLRTSGPAPAAPAARTLKIIRR